MKNCPVCNTQVEDQYTNLCPNTDCTQDFEFISEITHELKAKYEEKLKRARAVYSRIENNPHISDCKVILIQSDYIGDFSYGLARVKINNKWGFIDTKGEIVIPIKYDDVNCFNGGYASVYIDDEWIEINKYGEVL